MTDAADVRYARAQDGAYLAYTVTGDGDRPILAVHSFAFSVDSLRDEPHWAAFDRRLARIGPLVRYDVRGLGLSETGGPEPTDEVRTTDALAVLDAVGARRVVLLATDGGAATALPLAAFHPDRVSALVIVNGYARLERADDYPQGVPRRLLERFVDEVPDPGGSDPIDDVQLTAPSLVDDVRFRQWWQRASRRAVGPRAAREILRFNSFADRRPLLADIQVPTLVVHRRDNGFVRVGHGRYLADHIPNAQYVELDGADHLAWTGDAAAILSEIEAFLGAASGGAFERRVATLLFADVVESTERAAHDGDRVWRTRLDAHDLAVRSVTERFGGRVVKFIGDGVLAEFPTPSLAIDAARELVRSSELPLRVGVHTGEVEVRSDDLAGLAVHIAARVQARAHDRQILVSRTVADLVVGSGTGLASVGAHDLKGVPGRWDLFEVTP